MLCIFQVVVGCLLLKSNEQTVAIHIFDGITIWMVVMRVIYMDSRKILLGSLMIDRGF